MWGTYSSATFIEIHTDEVWIGTGWRLRMASGEAYGSNQSRILMIPDIASYIDEKAKNSCHGE